MSSRKSKENSPLTVGDHARKIVKMKVNKSAMKYLVSRIKSKGKEIKYKSNLECQAYLKPNNILTLQEQRTIFSFRARMNKLSYNFQGSGKVELCQCEEELTNIHLYECQILNNIERKVPYNKIFEGRLCEMKYIVNMLLENQNKVEIFTQAQDISSLSR